MNVVEMTTGVQKTEEGPVLTWDAQTRATVSRIFDRLENVLSSEDLMLPSRDHFVVDRFLVEVTVPDPVAALDFRLGYDAAAMQLFSRRLARARIIMSSTKALQPQDVDDLCAALTVSSIYVHWRLKQGAGNDWVLAEAENLQRWFALVVNELCQPAPA